MALSDLGSLWLPLMSAECLGVPRSASECLEVPLGAAECLGVPLGASLLYRYAPYYARPLMSSSVGECHWRHETVQQFTALRYEFLRDVLHMVASLI